MGARGVRGKESGDGVLLRTGRVEDLDDLVQMFG